MVPLQVGKCGGAGALFSIRISLCFHTGEGRGNLLQYSCLEIPLDRGAWLATIHRIVKSRTQLKQLSSTQVLAHRENLVHCRLVPWQHQTRALCWESGTFVSPPAVACPSSAIQMQDKGEETSRSQRGEGGCLRPEVTSSCCNPGQEHGVTAN